MGQFKNSCLVTFFVSCVIWSDARCIRKECLPNPNFNEKHKSYWYSYAQQTLKWKVSTPLNTRVAKNIILFIGDGMSIPTIAATRAYLGQKYEATFGGEELKLGFESFPFTGLAKTYCVDVNVPDSACSGTAYLSGVKANVGTVGVSGEVEKNDCKTQMEGKYNYTGLMDWAQRAGKRTGLVTTTRVTHATPAASYAHSANRKWEADTDLPKNAFQCPDIAKQLVTGAVGSKINVVFGGGRRNFFPNKHQDHEGYYGYRTDKKDLITEWLNKKKYLRSYPKYIYNRTQLMSLETDVYDNVLGLFSPDHMPYNLEALDDDPSLTEMTTKAIEMLSKNKNGYFLFVEGGKIDIAHHETKARKALDETAELSKAVLSATKMVDPADTLIIVTSDHSHTMSYNGYSKRGNDILGFSQYRTKDKLPYTTLSYANGPGYKPSYKTRYNLAEDDLSNANYTFPSLVPMDRETHGGEDVAVYAQGPWAHIFSGNFEQNYIPHAIAYASCIGSGLTACNHRNNYY